MNSASQSPRYRALAIDMRWLRLVGSLKIWVSFAEYSLFYRALLGLRQPPSDREDGIEIAELHFMIRLYSWRVTVQDLLPQVENSGVYRWRVA